MWSARLLLALALAAASELAHAAVVPLARDPEFQVNTYTTGDQSLPAVGAAGGRAVMVWYDENTGRAIASERYNKGGQALGEIVLGTTSSGDASVAMDGAGGFVVVWSQGEPGEQDVFGRQFDVNGMAVAAAFQVNTYTTGRQLSPDVSIDGAGNFVVVWQGDIDHEGIFGQRFTMNGATNGGEFTVNTYTTGTFSGPRVDANAMGDFVVVWQKDDAQDLSGTGIFAQRHAANGMALGDEIAVNNYTTGDQRSPDVSTGDEGEFVIVWSGVGESDSDGVFMRRFGFNGMALTGQTSPAQTTAGTQDGASVGFGPNDRFVVAWRSVPPFGSSAIFARELEILTSLPSAEFRVSTDSTPVTNPDVAVDAAGNFVVAWSSVGGDGHESGIFAQRYVMAATIKAKKAQTKDPTGAEDKRKTQIQGKERDTDIGAAILGDPTQDGATLRIVIDGAAPSDQTYELDAAGWSAAGSSGYRYRGPTGIDGDPVKQVLLKRTSGGTAQLKVKLTGNVGTQDLDVLPPNGAEDGGAILTIHGGGTYCVLIGGEAGGTTQQDDAQQWKMKDATGEGCPSPSGAFLDPPSTF